MLVKDVMTSKLITVLPTATIAEAIDLMIRNKISGLPVVDASGTLVGIVSESDFLRRVEIGTLKKVGWLEALLSPGKLAETYEHTRGRYVKEAMTSEVYSVADTADLKEAVALMQDHKIKRVPVTAGGKVVGLLTRSDVLRSLRGFLGNAYEEPATSDRHIQEQILKELGKESWAPVASVTVDVREGIVTFGGVLSDDRQRGALRVLAENIDGVHSVQDHMVWVEPYSGMTVESAEDAAAHSRA